MKTLYDILGALPDDDAESIRAAFRKAAKANHPDNNPGDPDAPLRFRRTVRANAILRDERQRATYDRLLEIALKQRASESERGSSSGSIRKIAPDAIAVVLLLTIAFVGGYLLLGHISKASLFSAEVIEGYRREPAQIAAAIPAELSDRIDLAGPREKFEEVVAPNKPVDHKPLKEAAVPSASPFVGKTGNATAITDVPRLATSGRMMPDTIESAGSWRIAVVTSTSRSSTSIWRLISTRASQTPISIAALSSIAWAISSAHLPTSPRPSELMPPNKTIFHPSQARLKRGRPKSSCSRSSNCWPYFVMQRQGRRYAAYLRMFFGNAFQLGQLLSSAAHIFEQ